MGKGWLNLNQFFGADPNAFEYEEFLLSHRWLERYDENRRTVDRICRLLLVTLIRTLKIYVHSVVDKYS